MVARDGHVELVLPELGTRSWGARIATPDMAVPETAVDQTHGGESGKNEIRLSREVLIVQAIAQPTLVQRAAQGLFRFSVLGSDRCHDSGPGVGIEDIGHAAVRGGRRAVLIIRIEDESSSLAARLEPRMDVRMVILAGQRRRV